MPREITHLYGYNEAIAEAMGEFVSDVIIKLSHPPIATVVDIYLDTVDSIQFRLTTYIPQFARIKVVS